jgi:hypothetical protein
MKLYRIAEANISLEAYNRYMGELIRFSMMLQDQDEDYVEDDVEEEEED